MVERNDLPENLWPENRNILSRMRTRIENGGSEASSVRGNSPKHEITEEDNSLVAHLKRTK